MLTHSETIHSPYSPQQLFELVADIERYPEFLPWCVLARITKREENLLHAELVIAFRHLRESYTSKVVLKRYESIEVEMIEGPFDYLTNSWRFTEEKDGTQIDFTLSFRFKSRLLEKLIGTLFARATQKMVTAFSKRADELYGKT